jgi:hypothetical protein
MICVVHFADEVDEVACNFGAERVFFHLGVLNGAEARNSLSTTRSTLRPYNVPRAIVAVLDIVGLSVDCCCSDSTSVASAFRPLPVPSCLARDSVILDALGSTCQPSSDSWQCRPSYSRCRHMYNRLRDNGCLCSVRFVEKRAQTR